MSSTYALGIDYGTNSVRALLVETQTGFELATSIFEYPHGEAGIILDSRDPNVARQHPADYLAGLEATIKAVLAEATRLPGFSPSQVIGIGVDTTGSTPLPVDHEGMPLALRAEFAVEADAMAWLWKDHSAHAEAGEITAAARRERPQYLAKCGGSYSSEWFWSKILHCARSAPRVFEAAATWVEHADWIPAILTDTQHPSRLRRGICAAGHKAMFNAAWGGYPDAEFLGRVDPALARVRATLPSQAHSVADSAGRLCAPWAQRLGLPVGIPVAIGLFDAHSGGIGSGMGPATLVKIIGTSTCDMMVAPLAQPLPDIPGLCGIVPESILPGHFGLEAGQSAVGDIFNWFVNVIGPHGLDHATLTASAGQLRPGQSGLLALDWHNGNRTVLIDQRLTGLIVGLTLHTTPAEIYRALVEATAFGARMIMERFEEYGLKVERIVNCGGISAKNPLAMQIYADVMGRPVQISRSAQTCALGAAICGAVAGGAHADFAAAMDAMTGIQDREFKPHPGHRRVYDQLFELYRAVHDAFGIERAAPPLYDAMKTLLAIRDASRADADGAPASAQGLVLQN